MRKTVAFPKETKTLIKPYTHIRKIANRSNINFRLAKKLQSKRRKLIDIASDWRFDCKTLVFFFSKN